MEISQELLQNPEIIYILIFCLKKIQKLLNFPKGNHSTKITGRKINFEQNFPVTNFQKCGYTL